ncbi:MAG TPA: DUF6049 family protein [Acidimicrobiales bacterium]|nr:DUF6049 family protein [Acidimicrobiales bacterium]
MRRALLCALVLLATGVVPAAAQPQQTPRQSRTDILQLVSQSPVIEPDGVFMLRLRVVGVPTGARLRLQVRNRVPTRIDFNAAVSGRFPRGTVGQPIETPAVPDASGIAVATIATRDPQSTAPPQAGTVRLGEGVYPVSVDLVSSSGATLDSLLTFLVRLPTSHDSAPLGVAVVLPEGGRLARQPDGSTALDPSVAQLLLSHAAVLQTHNSIPVTIAPTPETLDALEPNTLAEVKKGAAGRQVTLTPYVRMHAADWLTAGLDAEVKRQFTSGVATVRSKLASPDETTYVADGSITPEFAELLRERGVKSLVVPDVGLSPLDGRVFNRTLTQPFTLKDLDGVQVAAADAGLSAHVAETGDPVLDANHLLADLAVLFFDDPPDTRGTVVAFGNDQRIDPQFLDTLLSGLAPSNRMLRPMTLSTMFSAVPRAGSKGETNGKGAALTRSLVPDKDSGAGGFAGNVHAAENELASYKTMVTADNPRVHDFESRLLVAGAAELSDSDRTRYLDGVRDSITNETHKIEPPPRQTISFTARDGVVSLTLRNATGYPVKVHLLLEGEKLEFPDHQDGTVDVTLADERTQVQLNVRTRASGDSPLDVSVMAPDGGLEVGRTRITVRSTAFSGVGIVLSVGAGTFLAAWWIRNVVKTRRERRRRLKHLAAGNGGRLAT